MKNKNNYLMALIAIMPSITFAQVDSTTLERSNQPPSSVTSGNGSSANVDASDTGAQRPIFLKTENITAFAGLDSKIYYDDNPLSANNELSKFKDAVWSNTAYFGAGFGQIELTDAVITPYAGASWTTTEYLASGLDFIDYTSNNIYVMANIQHSNGWSYRAGVSYSSDSNQKDKIETYSEFYPYIGALKTYSHSEDMLGIFNISMGFHDTDSDPFPYTYSNVTNKSSRSSLNNFDIIASYGIQYIYNNFIISPVYTATFKSYNESGTFHEVQGREDLIHYLNVSIDYPVNENIKLSLFGGLSKRDTKNSGIEKHDFEKGMAGLSLGLNTTF
jgi:hypothetical protein